MMKNYIWIVMLFLAFAACTSTPKTDRNALSCSGDYIHFSIDSHTTIPKYGIFIFENKEKKKYLTFQNQRNEILIYELSSGACIKRITLMLEGDNAINAGFAGYYIHDFEHIFVPNLALPTLSVVDSAASIRKVIDFSTTDKNEPLIPLILSPSKPITVIGDKLYIPQTVNPAFMERAMDDSRVGAVIDTANHSIKTLPMKFPALITHKDMGTSAGFGADYAYCYDGEKFLYAFYYSHTMYYTDCNYENIHQVEMKSRYVDDISVIRINSTDLNEVVKATCEAPAYGDMVYDKYRGIFYRFVYHKTELDPNDNPFDILNSGRKIFSIMILDKRLNVLGETIFPEYTYNSKLYFVLEDGLYLSTNHIKNPGYSDDVLTFERIDLI